MTFSVSEANSDVIELNYGSWTIRYNCEKRGYQYFHYTTVLDVGDLPRFNAFHIEKQLPKNCSQFSTTSYKRPKDRAQYDRGHGVHQNLWDHDIKLMQASNSFANIVPQASKFNRRGVWRKTEILTECWRDIGTVEVWGGVIWGTDVSNDHFIESHGIVTPDLLWKVVRFPNGEVNAWLMPNDDSPIVGNMDRYLILPVVLSKLTGIEFDITVQQLNGGVSSSMSRPTGCSVK